MLYPESKLDPNYKRNKFFNDRLKEWINIQKNCIMSDFTNAPLKDWSKLLMQKYQEQLDSILQHIWKEWDKQNV